MKDFKKTSIAIAEAAACMPIEEQGQLYQSLVRNEDKQITYIADLVRAIMLQDPNHHREMMVVVGEWLESSVAQLNSIELRVSQFSNIEVLSPLRDDLLAACEAGKFLSTQALLPLRTDYQTEMAIREEGCTEPERQASFERLHKSFMKFLNVLLSATSRASDIEFQMIMAEQRYIEIDEHQKANLASLEDEKEILEGKLVSQEELEKRKLELLDLPLPERPFYDVKFFASLHQCSDENVRRHFRNWRQVNKEILGRTDTCYFEQKDKDKAERFHRYLKANRRSSRSQPKPRKKKAS